MELNHYHSQPDCLRRLTAQCTRSRKQFLYARARQNRWKRYNQIHKLRPTATSDVRLCMDRCNDNVVNSQNSVSHQKEVSELQRLNVYVCGCGRFEQSGHRQHEFAAWVHPNAVCAHGRWSTRYTRGIQLRGGFNSWLCWESPRCTRFGFKTNFSPHSHEPGQTASTARRGMPEWTSGPSCRVSPPWTWNSYQTWRTDCLLLIGMDPAKKNIL